MKISNEEYEKFHELAKPLIKWLNDTCNPHTKIIIDTSSAEVVSGETAFFTEEFIKD